MRGLGIVHARGVQAEELQLGSADWTTHTVERFEPNRALLHGVREIAYPGLEGTT